MAFINEVATEETLYWLHLTREMKYISEDRILLLEKQCRHIHFMLNKSILTIKSKLE